MVYLEIVGWLSQEKANKLVSKNRFCAITSLIFVQIKIGKIRSGEFRELSKSGLRVVF